MLDARGKAYEESILRVVHAAKKTGEFFTPFELSALIGQVLGPVQSVYDPACGSGSLLLSCDAKQYFGQELSPETAAMARKNLPGAHIVTGDTLASPGFDRTFDAVVSNPPYSTPWEPGAIDPFDPRWAGKTLAPKSKADLAFLQHIIYHADKTAVCVMFPGALYRSGREAKIRQELGFYLDAVIQLPEKLFMRTTIHVCLLILRRVRSGPVLWIDASNEFRPSGKQNVLITDRILETIKSRQPVPRFAELAEIEDDSWAVTQYVDSTPPPEPVDIKALREEVLARDARYFAAAKKWNTLVDWMEDGMPDESRPDFLDGKRFTVLTPRGNPIT